MAIETSKEFGQRLINVRNRLNVNQKDFAAKLDMHACNLSAVESGKSNPTARLLTKLSKLFDVSLDYLFRGTGEMFLTDKIRDAKNKIKSVESIESLEDLNWVALNSTMFRNTILGYAATFFYGNRDNIRVDIKRKMKKKAKGEL
jgi:transcriptional regulator with XRE-family HTH domain